MIVSLCGEGGRERERKREAEREGIKERQEGKEAAMASALCLDLYVCTFG